MVVFWPIALINFYLLKARGGAGRLETNGGGAPWRVTT